ncbi:MAG: hypothetical protein ABWX65_04280 [Mycetocola sp.]
MSTSDQNDPEARTRAFSTTPEAAGTASTPAAGAPEAHGAVAAEPQASYRKEVTDRQKEQFGGFQFGAAFFGWLAATGLVVLLSALAAGIATAVTGGVDEVVDQAASAPFGGILVYAIVVLVILFIAYYCGGYVAGRMARFSGAKQGLAVWIWGMVVTGLLVAVAAIAGSQLDVLSRAGVLPQIAFGPDQVLGTALTIAGAVVVTLLGAILGGVAGMRFHRRVDRAGWANDDLDGRA